MVQEVRREDSFESWPRPFDLDLVVEFSDDEADLWVDSRGLFSEAGRCDDMLTESKVSIEPGAAFALRRRGDVVLLPRKDVVCSFDGCEKKGSTYPLSVRFIVDP
jgi:hypothetical protein